MTTGFFLVVSILILGGVIATAGDRIGMKVGKARLSLFKLRPRQTATLITILTGGIISASTLGILFAVSDQLRRGVFDLEEIQDDLEAARSELSTAERELSTVESEKERIERELGRARADRREARQRLRRINEFLETAIARQAQTETELERVEANFEAARQRLQEVSQQTSDLQAEITALQQESREIIEDRDRQIAAREQEIALKEAQLRALEVQRANLEEVLIALEREIQALREGNVALLNNQVLSAGVVQIMDAEGARQVVDQLLRRANEVVLQELLPGTTSVRTQVVQITNTEVEQLLATLQPGEEYVVQILAGGNYLVGEPCVVAGQTCIQVTANAVPNQLLFQPNEVIAATTVEPTVRSQEELAEKLEFLIAATQFRAKQAGVLSDSVRISDNQEEAVTYFFEKFAAHQQTSDQNLTVRAIATQPIFTTGPLFIKLDATVSGNVLFSTEDTSSNSNL
ncbi:MAG: DUF3084 domain-containing protein [Leptolyngbyaceae bacterium]|nr:DUF3084 domain-containing protein [Leptolyngbyaceae bacterium]